MLWLQGQPIGHLFRYKGVQMGQLTRHTKSTSVRV